MAITLADLITDLSGRLEEVSGASVFWSETYEMLPALVDAMFEAALVTGTVQAVNIPVTLPANTTYISLQNNTAIGIPEGVIAALRLRLPWPIRKTSLEALDSINPNWEQETVPTSIPNWQQALLDATVPAWVQASLNVTTPGWQTTVLDELVPGWETSAPGSTIQAWFPLGVSAFGIYPQLASQQTALMDFIVSPVTVARPYTTAITVPFLTEFTDLLPMGAAVTLRSKELGGEAEEAAQVMQDFMGQLRALSLYQNRLDAQVWTTAYGAKAGVQKREIV